MWVGARTGNGYGLFRWDTRHRMTANRAAYRLFVDEVADGLEVDHLCRVVACVNPAHLEAVTVRVNNDRRLLVRGTAHHNGRKTECPKGHPLAGANLYLHPGGRRVCRECSAASQRRYRLRQVV